MFDTAFNKVAMRLPLYTIDFYRDFLKDEVAGLKRMLSDKVFLDALYLASPQLYYAVINTEEAALFDNSRKARKLRLSLLRYIYRISTRCTPFGLFAGCSVATLGDATDIVMNDIEAFRQHTRLDMQYLFSLADSLRLHPDIKPYLKYTVNTSLYRLGDAYRYVECSYVNNARKFELVSIAVTEYVSRAIEAAAAGNGLSIGDIAALLTGDGVTPEDALTFVGYLVDEQVLVSNLDPKTTGAEMEEELMIILADVAAAAASEGNGATAAVVWQYLEAIRQGASAVDNARPGLKMPLYQQLKANAVAFDHPLDEKCFIQTDLIPTSRHAFVDRQVIDAIKKGIDIVTRLSTSGSNKRMDKFRAAFEHRYESRAVPLVEALDIEAGIGYGDHLEDSSGDYSALIQDLAFRPAKGSNGQTTLDTKLGAFWTARITAALVNHSPVVEITDEDLASLPAAADKLSSTYTVMASLYKDQQEQDMLYFQGVSGPTAATWLGRFCNGDQQMKELVEEIVAAEEAQHKDKIVAEITHLPAARLGNVLQRPALRKFEIPYLAGSALPKENQLSINDLMLCIREGRMIVFSRQHNKEVLPYLTNSHFYSNGTSLPLYHFLCDMQELYGQAGCVLDMRSMQKFFRYIPRIVYKNIILKRASWAFSNHEFDALMNVPDEQLLTAFGAFAAQHGLPEVFCIAQGDNELVINRNSLFSLQVMLNEVKGLGAVVINEVLFHEYASPIRNGKGEQYNNEFLFFFKKEGAHKAAIPEKRYLHHNRNSVRREFLPGSEWVYFNLYTGFKSADKILLHMQPVIQTCLAKNIIDKSFFIRYHDPRFHLRLRFHLTEHARHDQLYHELYPVMEALKEQQVIWRASVDTYQRELERYGFETIEYMESIFFHDSMMCMSLIRAVEEEGHEELRWLAGFYAANSFLDAFGLSLEEKKKYAEYMSGQFAKEFGASKEHTVILDGKFRTYRNRLFSFAGNGPGSVLERRLKEIVAERDRAILPLIGMVSTKEGYHKTAYVDSLIHMSVNRLFRSKQRIYECVIYNLLKKYYTSVLAQQPVLV